MKQKKSTGYSGSVLKTIAMVTMLIDHTAATLLDNGLLPEIASAVLAGHSYDFLPSDYQLWYNLSFVMRLIGRLAFPLYAFLLVEGFLHTKSVGKYALRLCVFALLSEVPFDLAMYNNTFYLGAQNVFFTLLLGLFVLWGMKSFETLPPEQAPLRYLIALTGMMAAEFLQTDYGAFGVLLIVLLYMLKNNRKRQCLVGAISTVWEYTAPLAFWFVYRYNGERGKQLPKLILYAFYPVHLGLLVLLRYWIF